MPLADLAPAFASLGALLTGAAILRPLASGDALPPFGGPFASCLALLLRSILAGSGGAALLAAIRDFAALTPGFDPGANSRPVLTTFRARLTAFRAGFCPSAVPGLGASLSAIGARFGARSGRRPSLFATLLLTVRGAALAAVLILGAGRKRYCHGGGAGEQ